MVEGREMISDTIEILTPFTDDSVISERIVALKQSKAGHLSEITKIYCISWIAT